MYRPVEVWWTKNERYRQVCLTPSFKSGQISVMVWSAFVGSSKPNFTVIPPGQRIAVDFVNIIYEGVLLALVAEVSNAILLDDPQGVPV